MGEVLKEDHIYEGGDIPNRGVVRIEDIEYTNISLVHLSDVSLLERCNRLRILGLRMCSLVDLPAELLSLHFLESIDLSGNMIERLPDPGSYARWERLRALNLSDNGIRDLAEIEKLKEVASLRRLSLIGNVCVSANNSFIRVTQWFPSLLVLNDNIVTSQFRAKVDGLAVDDRNATLPISKTDDYYFLFVKYMHVPGRERYVRKANAEFFCLHRVMRRFSAADKIQSIVRGFLARTAYKRAHNAGVFIRDYVRYWYHRRMVAADKIQRAFLHFLLKQRIKRTVCARKIQSAWERYRDRQMIVIRMFEMNEKFEFFVSQRDLEVLKNYINSKGMTEPESVFESNYIIIRQSDKAKPSKLPGSPVIWYCVDDRMLIREIHHKSPSNLSIWCGHDHSSLPSEQVVSKSGVNWAKSCRFDTFKPKPCQAKTKKLKFPEYPRIVECQYTNCDHFSAVIRSLLNDQSHGITIFTESTLRSAAAHFRIQASCRCFLVRRAYFKKAKREVLETRAATAIQRFFRNAKRKESLCLSIETLHYYRTIPDNHSFFISKNNFLELSSRVPKRKVAFGFSNDKTVVFTEEHRGVLGGIIPIGRANYPGHNLLSLFKIGAVTSVSQTTTFNNKIPAKWLRRCGIIKIIFGSAGEARRRLALFAYMTGDMRTIMSEGEVLRYCAACSIQCGWIGFTSRRLVTHMGAQLGKKLNLKCLIPQDSSGHKVSIKHNERDDISQEELTIEDQIAFLRNDYQQWRKLIEQRKASNAGSETQKSGKSSQEQSANETMTSLNFENISQNKSAESDTMPQPILKKRAIQTATKPKVGFRSVKKIIPFLYETESDKTFGMRLADLTLRPPSEKVSLKARPRTSQTFHQTGSPNNEFSIIGTGSSIPRTSLSRGAKLTMLSSRYASNATSRKNIGRSTDIDSMLDESLYSSRAETIRKTQSPQQSDTSFQKLVEAAFSRLCRLRQLGIIIQQGQVSDNTIEEKHKRAQAARTAIREARQELDEKRTRELTNTRNRNRIVTEEMKQARSALIQRVTNNRNAKAIRMRTAHLAAIQKAKREKTFASTFVAASRQVSSMSEKAHRNAQKARDAALTHEASAAARRDHLETKQSYKQKVHDISRQKRQETQFENALLAQRREAVLASKVAYLETVHNNRGRDLQRAKTALANTRQNPHIPMTHTPCPALDEHATATADLTYFVGRDLGAAESHLLVDILSDALEL